MGTVAEKRRDTIALIKREFEPDGVQILVQGETPEDGDRFIKLSFVSESSEQLGIGSNWKRHRGRLDCDVYVKKLIHDETGPDLVDDLTSSISNLLNGTVQETVYFRNARQQEKALENGFWENRVTIDWFFDSDLAPGTITNTRFEVVYGIGEYTTPDEFLGIGTGTVRDVRYYRERMIRFGPTTVASPRFFFRLPHDTDKYEIINNVLMTRIPDETWTRHENPDGTIYIVSPRYTHDTVFVGIVEFEPGS